MYCQCSQYHSLRHSSILLLSYSSVCYSSLSSLNIPSCTYIFICEFFSCSLFFCSVLLLLLMIKCIWLWSLHPSGSHILTLSTNSFCELKTMSNTFLPLVGSNTCWERKLSCTKLKKILDPLSQYSVEVSTVYAHG